MSTINHRYSKPMAINSSNNRRDHLVRQTVTDKNGVTRTVWVVPADASERSKVKLPAPGLGAPKKAPEAPAPSGYTPPIQKLAKMFKDIRGGLADLNEHSRHQTKLVSLSPVFLDYTAWMDDQNTDTLHKIRDIMEVSSEDKIARNRRAEILMSNAAPEELSVIHANREFLDDNANHPEFFVNLAAALGTENLEADGRIMHIDEHMEVNSSFKVIEPDTYPGPYTSYSDAVGLHEAVNHYPERATEIAAWGKFASENRMKEAVTTPGVAIEVMETMDAYPEQQEKINKFLKERGTGFSRASYEAYEAQHDALEEGTL